VSTPTSSPGRAIGGRYRLEASVGRGGMGTVWEAYDETLRRRVAVKEVLLPAGIPADERAMLCERTLREARSAARLTHPSVVVIYDVVEEDDRPWIVMELLNALSLADLVRDHGPLPADQVASVGLQVLAALEAAHTAGILHRDVKPGNVLLAPDGRATLTDFGVARASGDSTLTSTGLLLGSPSYISPERARGGDPTPASDLWALGATLYAAVEGQAPFERGDPLPTLTAVVGEPPDPMRLAGPLEPVLAGLLVKDVGYRWDAERTRSGLRAALPGAQSAGQGTSSVPPAHASVPPAPSWAPPNTSAGPDFPSGPPVTSAPPEPGSVPAARGSMPGGASWAGAAGDANGAGATGGAQPGTAGRGSGWPEPATAPSAALWPPQHDDSSGGADVGLAALLGHSDSDRTAATPAAAATATFPPAQQEQAAAQAPTAYQQPPSDPATPTRSRRPMLVALIVVGLVVVIVGGYLLGTGLSGGGSSVGAGPSAPVGEARATSSPSATASASASASASSSVTTALTPYSATDGYQVSVPSGWTPTSKGNGVTDFNDPQGGRFVRYGASSAPTDALTMLTQGEQTFESSSGSNDYQRIRLSTTQVLGRDGAVWEFRFTTASGERRRARYETFVDNGVAYELYVSSRDDQWSSSQAMFARSMQTFTVTG